MCYKIAAAIIMLFAAACSDSQTKIDPSTEPALKSEMTAFFTVFKTALEVRDFDRIETLLADDFVYQEPGSPVLSKDGLLEREKRGASGGPISEVSYKVLSASEEQGVISSGVELRFETRLPKGDEVVLFTGVIAQDVTAVRAGDDLLFRSVTVREQQLFRNGEPVGAEAIAEMHAGEGDAPR